MATLFLKPQSLTFAPQGLGGDFHSTNQSKDQARPRQKPGRERDQTLADQCGTRPALALFFSVASLTSLASTLTNCKQVLPVPSGQRASRGGKAAGCPRQPLPMAQVSSYLGTIPSSMSRCNSPGQEDHLSHHQSPGKQDSLGGLELWSHLLPVISAALSEKPCIHQGKKK